MGGTSSIFSDSLLRCILIHCDKLHTKTIQRDCLLFLCNNKWSKYPLGENEQCLLFDSIKYNVIFELYLYCKEQNKWPLMAYTEALWSSPRGLICTLEVFTSQDQMLQQNPSYQHLLSIGYVLSNLLSQYPQEQRPSLESSHTRYGSSYHRILDLSNSKSKPTTVLPLQEETSISQRFRSVA